MKITVPTRRRVSKNAFKRPGTPTSASPSGLRRAAHEFVKYDELDYRLMATFPASDAIARY